MLDKYFKKPLFWDYLLVVLVVSTLFTLYLFDKISLPENEFVVTISSDVSNIGFTSSGFILTLLTVLITFKGSSRITKKTSNTDSSVFQMFFASDLYFDTVGHLKNCIKSLLAISILGYALKLGLPKSYLYVLYFCNIAGLIIIVATLWRCLLILSKIIKIQEENN